MHLRGCIRREDSEKYRKGNPESQDIAELSGGQTRDDGDANEVIASHFLFCFKFSIFSSGRFGNTER
jgi:hypothetical protein